MDKLPPAKTEPPNPYLQYLMVRRIALVNIDPKGVLNIKSVNEDWKKLSDEERNEYRVLTQTDKVLLGSRYRKRMRKNVEEKTKKKNQQKLNQVVHDKSGELVARSKKSSLNKAGDGTEETENSTDIEDSIASLLDKLVKIDSEIDCVSAENDI